MRGAFLAKFSYVLQMPFFLDIPLMEEAVQELNSYLINENRRLQELADLLQEKHRAMSQEVRPKMNWPEM